LTPGKAAVLEAVQTASDFADYVLSCVAPTLLEQVQMLLNQPQLGFNTRARMYSVPYPTSPFQSYVTAGKKSASSVPDNSVARLEASPRR
jgi:hypothetical protein